MAVAVGVALSAARFLPLAAGRVPFPADIVLNFPLWEEWRGGAPVTSRHAELGDLAAQVYPWRLHAKRTVAQGELPLWNPHVLLGVPFVAAAQTAVFYPPHLLYHVLPTPAAWALMPPLRTLLGVVFAAALACGLGASPRGGAVAGVIFACSGFMVAWQGWAHVDSAVWIPAAMAAADALHRRADGKRVVLVAGALAASVLGGHPEAAVYAAMAAAAMALYRLVLPRPGSAPRLRFAAAFAAGAALAGLLAALQILPTLEWLPTLVRPSQGFVWPSMPIAGALAFVSRDASSNPNSAGFDIPEGAVYVGLTTWLLAAWAPFHERRGDTGFTALVLAGALQLAYGFGPAYAMAMAVPVLSALPHDRAVVLAGLALAVLAGLGFTAFETRRRPAMWAAALLAAAGLAGAIGVVAARAGAASMFGARGLLSSAIVLVASVGLLLAGLARPAYRGRCVMAALAVLAVDLVTFSFGHVPFFRAADVYPEPPLLAHIPPGGGRDRVVFLDGVAPPNLETAFGRHSPAGQEYVMKDVARLIAPFTGDATRFLPDGFRAAHVTAHRGRLLDLLAVRYLVATTDNESAGLLAAAPQRFTLVRRDHKLHVFENRTALPRAFLVPASGIHVAADEEAWTRLTADDFDPERTAVLEAAPRFPADGAAAGADRVTGFVSSANTVDVEVEARRPSLLVLSDTYYPGWTARVDGTPAPIERVDVALRGVALGAGHHHVRFQYEPSSFRTGAVLSLVGIAACIVLWRTARSPDAAPPQVVA